MPNLAWSCNRLWLWNVAMSTSATPRITTCIRWDSSQTPSNLLNVFLRYVLSPNNKNVFTWACFRTCLGHPELGFVTAEKVVPSPIGVVADIHQAVMIERRSTRNGDKIPLKDVLNSVIAQFNKMTTVKRHRIEKNRKQLVYNMSLDFFIRWQLLVLLALYCNFFFGALGHWIW